jgi:hypothetical protein
MTERSGDPGGPDKDAARGDRDDPRGAPDAADGCIGCGLCGRHITTIALRRPVRHDPRPEGETPK